MLRESLEIPTASTEDGQLLLLLLEPRNSRAIVQGPSRKNMFFSSHHPHQIPGYRNITVMVKSGAKATVESTIRGRHIDNRKIGEKEYLSLGTPTTPDHKLFHPTLTSAKHPTHKQDVPKREISVPHLQASFTDRLPQHLSEQWGNQAEERDSLTLILDLLNHGRASYLPGEVPHDQCRTAYWVHFSDHGSTSSSQSAILRSSGFQGGH